MATRNRSEDLRTNPVVDAGYSGMRKVISMGDMAPCTHVLLLTNDQSTDALFHRLLTGAGYRVTVMHELQNKRQFMALAPDVLVLDLLVSARMEEGWDYLTLLRRDPDMPGIPVVLCTAAKEIVWDPVMAQELDHLGVRVLIKPVVLAQVLTAIAEALTATHLLDQLRDL